MRGTVSEGVRYLHTILAVHLHFLLLVAFRETRSRSADPARIVRYNRPLVKINELIYRLLATRVGSKVYSVLCFPIVLIDFVQDSMFNAFVPRRFYNILCSWKVGSRLDRVNLLQRCSEIA